MYIRCAPGLNGEACVRARVFVFLPPYAVRNVQCNATQCSHEIHTQGDAFECAFVSVVDAVNFALDVQVAAVRPL